VGRTRDAARGKWTDILGAAGMTSAQLSGKHGPCPVGCDGQKSFRFDNKDGDGRWICTHCGAGDGVALFAAVTGLRIGEALRRVDVLAGTAAVDSGKRVSADERSKMRRVMAAWAESLPLSGDDPVSRYLQYRIGVMSDVSDIRHHPRMAHVDENGEMTWHPTMLSLVRAPDGKILTIHRTSLTEDGRKASVDEPKKLMPGLPIAGGAIRLSPIGSAIGIAEGIETALAAAELHLMPVWSVVSAAGMKSFEPPAGVKAVTIFSDNDKTFTGQAAAFDLAHRLTVNKGMRVAVKIPTAADWCDELRSGDEQPVG